MLLDAAAVDKRNAMSSEEFKRRNTEFHLFSFKFQ